MPRGGARIGAGRKPNPAAAKKTARAAPKAFAPDGTKSSDAPPNWPFGRTEVVTAPAEVAAAPPSEELTALALFQRVYRDEAEDMRTRLGAAAQALPFEAARPAPAGKKEAKATAAKSIGGKFAATAAPPLKLVNR